jgi:hypothetical protein
MAYDVRWSRPSADGGTTYTLPSGQRMKFAPGQVWVVFARGLAGRSRAPTTQHHVPLTQ